MTRAALAALVFLAAGCVALDVCEAGDPCVDGQVCVFWDGRALCSDACTENAQCGLGQTCDTCMGSGDCPECDVCVAACKPP